MENLDNHKRILGVLYVISGTLTLIGMLFLSTFFSVIFSLAAGDADPEEQQVIEWVGSMVQYVSVIVIIIVSVPTLIAGIGLLTKKSWAMLVALIVGCLKLFSFPLGTALGVYSIWIYMEEQKVLKKTT